MLTEITVRQIQRHVQLKTPIPRICADVGVGRTVVYRLISEGFDERIERMKRKKAGAAPTNSASLVQRRPAARAMARGKGAAGDSETVEGNRRGESDD